MKRQILFLLAVFCLMWIQVFPVKADSTEEALITISPDGEAFTTNAGERTTCWYKEGYEVLTGIKGTLRNPGIGEHLYTVIRKDRIPVKKWKVVLTGANASIVHIHPEMYITEFCLTENPVLAIIIPDGFLIVQIVEKYLTITFFI